MDVAAEAAPEPDPAPALRRDARENQQRILTAATAVVHQHGPHVPMAEIAAAAGVGVGTLYRRYPSREALLDALTCRSFGLVLANAEAAAAHPGTGLDALAHYFGLTIASRDALVLPLHGGPELTSDATRAARDDVHRTLRRIIDRGHRDGSVRADAATRDVVFFGALLAQPLAGTADWDAIAHRLKHVYVDGLAARPEGDPVSPG